MQDGKVIVGYIGNGKSANRYHAPYVLDRPDKFRIKTMQARHVDHSAWAAIPGVEYVTDTEAILGDPQIDVVEITTPSALHYFMAKRALEAGKHVTVDKPFSATYEEAAELFDLAAKNGVTVQCYQNRRFDSDYLTARKVVESGKLGKVFEVVTSYDYWRPTMMDGMANDPVNNVPYGHASHCLDQIISWFGTPDRVHSDLRQLQGAGMVCDYFDYDLYYDELGVKATAHANYRMAIQRPSFEIYGDKGAYVKFEKDQQERDLKHFYLPAGHPDFGLDAPEQWGTLRYQDEDGLHEERVPSERSSYSQWYDAPFHTVANGAPQLVTPEETLAQMRILEDGMGQLA
ncbi:Gfo/Idh/MocA family oxidoreductase [Olsenella phocaeensis]|uniref:Gfo/Idh/MocA family oxidoreductase n=1 Tax=Olsenella phocaeensis TaxID=1852385 RepID=UPI0009306C71|nr:Gfo/Idh/MocA family oxidoreductase [Olsenella phocaeensis]